jgi:hypothetical protein
MPLGDDEIAAGGLGSDRFLARPRLPTGQSTPGMCDTDQVGVGPAPEEIDHPAGPPGSLDRLLVYDRDQEVKCKRLLGAATDKFHACLHLVRSQPSDRVRAQAASLRHSCCQFGPANRPHS